MINFLRHLFRLPTRIRQTVAEAPLKNLCERMDRIITAREQWLEFGGHIIHEQQAQHRQTLKDLNSTLKRHIDENAWWLMREYSPTPGSCYTMYMIYSRRYQKYEQYRESIPKRFNNQRKTNGKRNEANENPRTDLCGRARKTH